MQAFPVWQPPGGALGRILAETRARVDELKRHRRELEAAVASRVRGPSMAACLRRGDVAVIAELKRRSPSRGDINIGLDPIRRAVAYVAGGAAAISVLTEPYHFGGSAEDLRVVRDSTSVPILRKDFHIDPVQLLEARCLGASGVLLIARAIAPALLNTLAAEARSLELEAVIEVRTNGELDRALATGAPIVGVNSRDLESLSMDPGVAERLIPLIPRDRIAVAESGVASRDDVERVALFGADAVLVGSSISAAGDPRAAVAALTDVERTLRAA